MKQQVHAFPSTRASRRTLSARALALAFLTLLPLATGCGSDPKPAPLVATKPEPTPEPPAVTPPAATAAKMAVNVDDDIVKACNLKFENIGDAPKFDYDSEQLTPGEKSVLEAIAKCVTIGPLKGRALDLVGRADPRGETEYNMTLGAKRARSVHTFLGGMGVAGDKLRDTSRGELDATGTDEDGWRKDRRVDVRLTK